jgi:transposase, IS30 family
MSYLHFSITERSQLYKLRVTDNLSMSVIASIMNRSKSRISPELKRNKDRNHRVYLPDTAEEMKKNRRAKSKERFKGVKAATVEEVKQRLKSTQPGTDFRKDETSRISKSKSSDDLSNDLC